MLFEIFLFFVLLVGACLGIIAGSECARFVSERRAWKSHFRKQKRKKKPREGKPHVSEKTSWREDPPKPQKPRDYYVSCRECGELSLCCGRCKSCRFCHPEREC